MYNRKVKSFTHAANIFINSAILCFLPYLMREIIQNHFDFLDSVRLLNSVSSADNINQAQEKSVCAFFCYCVRCQRVECFNWRNPFLIQHVIYAYFNVLIKLNVHLQNFIQTCFKFRVLLRIIVREHVFQNAFSKILINEFCHMHRYSNKFIFSFLNQFSMTDTQNVLSHL